MSNQLRRRLFLGGMLGAGASSAARVNGYLVGQGSGAQLRAEIDRLGLSRAGLAHLKKKRGV